MILFFTIAIALVILDFTLFGFLAFVFKMYPGYRHLLNDGVLIKDDTHNLDRSWEGDRYKSLIMTNKYFIIKNSFFTSVRNIDVESITLCVVDKKKEKRSKITVLFTDDGRDTKISFISDKAESWVSLFRRIGVTIEGDLKETVSNLDQ